MSPSMPPMRYLEDYFAPRKETLSACFTGSKRRKSLTMKFLILIEESAKNFNQNLISVLQNKFKDEVKAASSLIEHSTRLIVWIISI